VSYRVHPNFAKDDYKLDSSWLAVVDFGSGAEAEGRVLRRMTRLVMIVGGTALLVAMPREDYARLWAETQVAASRAYALINHHVVKPIRVAATSREDGGVISVPAPRPTIRPSLLDGEARQGLAAARMPELAPKRPRDGVGVAQDDPAAGDAAMSVKPLALRGDAGSRVPKPPAIVVAGDASEGEARSDATVPPAASAASVTSEQPGVHLPAAEPPAPGPTEVVAATAPDDAVQAADDQGAGEQAAAAAPPIPLAKPEVPPDKRPPVAAKLLFGAAKTAAPLAARSIGYYSRGCLAGGKALPVDGLAWQAMRLSRNRNWGHPNLIALIEQFAKEVQKEDGWPGLLVGDISQPRGGPMLTGHASHQVGLDADIWFTPMPGRRLSRRERENLSATSMIMGPTKVDPSAFTPRHVKVVKRAASYREVERILVHPAIKKALCEAAGSDRAWLGKVRPYFGHYYHFHIRLACPRGSANCRSQRPPSGADGCGKELDYWFRRLTTPPRPKPKVTKPRPPKPPITVADLPEECRVVLEAGGGPLAKDEAELVKTSIERSKKIIDISGEPRAKALARKAGQ
jgi:penicillin-insensitive murein endopeptidase